jgi:hypothetical protein
MAAVDLEIASHQQGMVVGQAVTRNGPFHLTVHYWVMKELQVWMLGLNRLMPLSRQVKLNAYWAVLTFSVFGI